VTAWGSPLLLRAFANEGEDRAHGLLADFLAELEERVAEDGGANLLIASPLVGRLGHRGHASADVP
jgi:hypothetical protein